MGAAATTPAPELPRVDGYEVREGRTCRWILAPVSVLVAGGRRSTEEHWIPLADYLAAKQAPPSSAEE